MKVGLLDVDGHNYPNLALMKLSSWHKSKGDIVEWVNYFFDYDLVYKSKVFTFTHDLGIKINSCEIIEGGTGYNMGKLSSEIEHIYPDYALYNEDKAYGFLTRGCLRNCSFCIVPTKEGKLRNNADITEFWNGQKVAILMDNNALASNHGLSQIEKIIKLKIKVDFNQGLDARLINNDIAKLLSRVKWHKPIRMACDNFSQIDSVIRATELLRKYGTTPKRYFIYVLVTDIQDALLRVNKLKKYKLDPFCQPLITDTIAPTDEQRRFARWVNHKAIFNSCEWKDYKY